MRFLWPRGGLWRHADFVSLWSAQTVSQFGTNVTLLALPLAAIVVLDASAFEVAVLGAMDFLPFLLFALPAGVWVDRLPRRPILIAADVGRAAVLLSVPAAAAFDVLTIWQLYAVGFAVGVLTVFFDVAYQSYLPSLVERNQLVEGNSKLEASRSVAQVGGPGIAGVLIHAVTAPFALIADALSYVGSAFFLLRIRRDESRPVRTEVTSMRAELLEGLRYVVRDRRWRAIAAYVASINFASSVAFSIFLVYAVRVLDLSAQLVGVALSLGSIGTVAGAVLASRISRRLGPGPTAIAAAIASGPPMLLIPLAPRSSPLPFLIASQLLVGFAVVVFNIAAISLMQALTPERLLGRMNASRRFMVWGTIPLGSVAGGVLASTVGLRPTLFAGGIAASFCFLFLLLSPLRSIKELPDEPPESLDPGLRQPLETQLADA